VDEIEYAFRQSGTTVRDWGKAMNLSLIDEVLIPYLGERKILSHTLEERKQPPPEQRIYTDAELDNLARWDVVRFYQGLRNGVTQHKIPEHLKDILVKDGVMKPEDALSTFFAERLGNGFKTFMRLCTNDIRRGCKRWIYIFKDYGIEGEISLNGIPDNT